MDQAGWMKIAAAFVGGVVVALGGALTYVRVSDVSRPQIPVQSMAPAVKPLPIPGAFPDNGQEQQTSRRQEKSNPEAGRAPEIHSAARESRYQHEPGHRIYPPTAPVIEHKIARQPAPVTTPGASQEPIQIAQNNPALHIPAPLQPTIKPVVNRPDSEVPVVPVPVRDQPEAEVSVAPVPHVVTLAAGTSIRIRLSETVSTENNYTGDTFRASLETPIIMDGFIIADKGSKVLGRVVSAQRAPRIGGSADLNLTLTEINTTDGQRVKIVTNAFDKRGPSNTGEDAAKVAGGAALGAIIGAIGGGGKGAAIGAGAGSAAGLGAVILTHGKAATLSNETRLVFQISSPVTITEKIN